MWCNASGYFSECSSYQRPIVTRYLPTHHHSLEYSHSRHNTLIHATASTRAPGSSLIRTSILVPCSHFFSDVRISPPATVLTYQICQVARGVSTCSAASSATRPFGRPSRPTSGTRITREPPPPLWTYPERVIPQLPTAGTSTRRSW